MARNVYADNAATTAVSPEVIQAMMPALETAWGNPSSLHARGREAKELLDGARARIAAVLGCEPNEIYFTSCGTESDNWAIKGAAKRMKAKGRTHIVTSAIEHHAVLNTCAALEKEGFTVTYVGVDSDGLIKMDELSAAVTDKTALVAIMYANNEVGTIEPIAEICEIAHAAGALMFTDAVQAVGNVDINLAELKVDMLSLSGHKLHAPKGIGALYIRKGVVIGNLIDGGGQERRRRAGTENLPYILGLAKALEIAKEKLNDLPRVAKMRDRLIENLEKIPYSKLNGHRTERLAGNFNIGFEFIEGESLLLWLDISGIQASTGSACSSASLEASHVLLAMGVPHEKAHGSLRLSISHDTTEEDIDYIIETVPGIVNRLREMSPLWEDVVKNQK
ncbi:MAG: cysteine desulfurase NifS [Clostridia bacterium]|nr:cysteine desulfurase NifS [Clostridia bacterium]